MKKIFMVLVLLVSIIGFNFAEENQQDKGITVYTFFVNIVKDNFAFPLVGFVNIAGGNQHLPQIGFVNWNQNNFSTLQWSFVNIVGGDMTGAQLAFVNVGSNNFTGAQISLVNVAKRLNGLQFGFINYTETVENGVPIGFFSIVRYGGYKAIELGVSEISPFNVSFKLGIEKFYTSFIVGYNPFRDDGIDGQIMMGIGFGSIIPFGEKFFFNPEIIAQSTSYSKNQTALVSIIPQIGYNIIPNLSVVIGPSLVWAYRDKDLENIFYSITEYKVSEKNKWYLGGRMALRLRW